MLYYALVTAYVLISFVLLVVVLLQQGKGGGIAAGFGGASSQTAFGARAGATVLTRATTVLGTLFLLGALSLTLVNRGGGTVVSGVDAPAAATEPAATLPMPELPVEPMTSSDTTEGAAAEGEQAAPETPTAPAAGED
jgi:preprotein translocase subunit SecG